MHCGWACDAAINPLRTVAQLEDVYGMLKLFNTGIQRSLTSSNSNIIGAIRLIIA